MKVLVGLISYTHLIGHPDSSECICTLRGGWPSLRSSMFLLSLQAVFVVRIPAPLIIEGLFASNANSERGFIDAYAGWIHLSVEVRKGWITT